MWFSVLPVGDHEETRVALHPGEASLFDADPDLHQSDKSDPDPHQSGKRDLDPPHIISEPKHWSYEKHKK
jgi:hypothetical protein